LACQSVDDFEIVVVDDRSERRDAVHAIVDPVATARVVDGEGWGPAAARNLGASAATSDVVCFTDDDCEPAEDWIATLLARFDDGDEVVAGPTLARVGSSAFVHASQVVTNHLVDASRAADGTVGFAPTSNIACRRTVHELVPFDESFPTAAGEDRAWCDRLRAAGHGITFEPTAVVRHAPALDALGFWRQQMRYGAGAHRYFASQGERTRPQSARFYRNLVGRGFADGVAVGLLVLVAQAATAVGLAGEAYRARR
jgi:cellulose synthase/poly-beta-1,6-N-acetylglucosamine synthase-like glycosyltransferase